MTPGFDPDQILGSGPQKRLATTDVAPPNSLYVSQDDTLYLIFIPSVGSVLMRTVIRLLTPEGDIKIMEYDYTTAGTRSPQGITANLGEGFILSVNIYTFTTNLQRGQCYVRFFFLRGLLNQAVLGQVVAQGYVTYNCSQFFPNGPNEPTVGGIGAIRTITGTAPAAGAEISETVPTGALWQLLSFATRLQCSAAVATRGSILQIDDGTNTLHQVAPFTTLTAGQARNYYYALQGNNAATGNGFDSLLLPNLRFMLPGWRIRTVTSSIDVGDQYATPFYTVMEWIWP